MVESTAQKPRPPRIADKRTQPTICPRPPLRLLLIKGSSRAIKQRTNDSQPHEYLQHRVRLIPCIDRGRREIDSDGYVGHEKSAYLYFTHDEAKVAAHFQTSLAKQRNAKLTRPESPAMSTATSGPASFTRTIRYVRRLMSLSRDLTKCHRRCGCGTSR